MSYSQQTSTGGGVGDVPAGCPLAKLGRSSPPYHHPSLADSYHNPSSRKQYSDINAVKTAAAYHLNCSHDTYPGEMIPLQTYSALACSRTKTPDTVLRNSPYDPYHSRDSPASFDSYHHQAKNSDNVRNSPAYELYCNLKNTDNGLPNRASYECFRNTNESENGYPNISTYERYPYTNDSSQDFDPYRNLKQHEDMLPNPYEHYHRPNKAEALTNSSSIYEHYHTQSKNENSPSAVCNSYHIRQKSESEVMNQVSYEHYFKSEGDRMVPGKSDTNMKSLEAYEKIKKRETSDARVPSNYDPYSAKTPDGVVRNSPAFEHYFSGQSSQWRYRPMEPRDTAYHIYRNETSYDSNANASYVYPNESLAASIYEKRYRSSGSEPFSLPHEQTYHSAVTQQSCNYIVDQIGKLGRSSPSLDQGYHTLVSPSPGPSTPGPWTESKNVFKGKSKIITRNNCFAMLPDNAILKIFAWLSSSELCVCAQVCRRFEHLVWDPSMWRTINLRGPSVSGDKAVRSILQRLSGHDQNAMCPTVERVFVSEGTRLTDKGLVLLARHCPELTHLQTQGCATLSNAALCELVTRCHNLQHLDVTGCTRLSTLAILEMPRKLQLQYLDLTDCSSVDDNSLRIIVENCPQLVYLYLRRCVQITDAGIKCVPSFCSALRELSVSDCVNLTDFGLYELAKLGATLRYLSVAKCDQVSDPGLKVIVRRCYKLRYLNARGCEAVSDDAITELARSCPRLRALDIGKCDVSDAGLAALAESCPNLKKLSLRSCELITDKGVECIAYYCRGLQLLNIQDCQITIEGYRAVKKYCKRCVIEHTNPGFF